MDIFGDLPDHWDFLVWNVVSCLKGSKYSIGKSLSRFGCELSMSRHFLSPIQHYGDFDLETARKKIDQTGAIKQLMG